MIESIHVFDDGIRLTEVQRLEKRLGEWQEDYFTLYNEKERLLGQVIRLEAELAKCDARTCATCVHFEEGEYSDNNCAREVEQALNCALNGFRYWREKEEVYGRH